MLSYLSHFLMLVLYNVVVDFLSFFLEMNPRCTFHYLSCSLLVTDFTVFF